MAEIKRISGEDFNEILVKHKFNSRQLAKDYSITLVLYLLKDIKNIYFKGGTALNKIFLNYSRLSEDIDFTVTKNIEQTKEDTIKILDDSKLFQKIAKDKDVEGFTRILVHYKDFDGKEDVIFVDLNERTKILTKTENYEIKHFYKGFIPQFSVNTLSKEEMVAEKIAAAIGRNKPRDHFDIYKIIKEKIPINMSLVEKKCKQSGDEFSIIKIFNNANKLKHRWDEDLVPLLVEEITFQEIMKTLAKYFKLKEAKEVRKSTDKKS